MLSAHLLTAAFFLTSSRFVLGCCFPDNMFFVFGLHRPRRIVKKFVIL
jgi:hypothetical protein